MNTIMILAEALANAAVSIVSRIDIQYNSIRDEYSGRVWIEHDVFDIKDTGEITKVKEHEGV